MIWWRTNQNRKLVSYKTSSAKDLKERSLATALFVCLFVFNGFGFFCAGGGFGGGGVLYLVPIALFHGLP